MNEHPLAEDYLRWLEPQVRDESQISSGRTYWDLIWILADKEFVWNVAIDNNRDYNRVVDGLDLRREYCHAHHIPLNSLEGLGECSFLEVVVGLSCRLAFAAGGTPPMWAWHLLQNLNLHHMADPLPRFKARKVDDITEAVIWRTYSPDGQGGFFPLAYAEEDQTKVEIWYQMAAYIAELHPEH